MRLTVIPKAQELNYFACLAAMENLHHAARQQLFLITINCPVVLFQRPGKLRTAIAARHEV